MEASEPERTIAGHFCACRGKRLTGIDKKLNFLLALLEDDVFRRWEPHLEVVELPLGKVLYEPGAELDHVYFPTTAIVSMLYVMKNGASAEIAVIGKDGMVGVSLFMGGGSTVSRAVVQSAGTSYRLPSNFLMSEFERGGPVMHLMLRYTQALLTQMSQTAVCNRHHNLHQQFCRWLLLSLDRLPGNELAMTQELISNMLGVRRGGVTGAARKLQLDGAIEYRRGKITVVSRERLESCTCECYEVVKTECERQIPAAVGDHAGEQRALPARAARAARQGPARAAGRRPTTKQ
jgi:CRP-like cAMP-binding protein